jgi:hypothetical protein
VQWNVNLFDNDANDKKYSDAMASLVYSSSAIYSSRFEHSSIDMKMKKKV